MAETAPTPTEARQVQAPGPPQAAPPLRFRPLLGGLTMMVLTVGGLIVLSPISTAAPRSR